MGALSLSRNAKEFVQFVAANHDVLWDMVRERAKFATTDEVVQYFKEHLPEASQCQSRVRQMRDLGILLAGPSEWAPAVFLSQFLNALHDHHAVATPSAIRGWIADLRKMLDVFRQRLATSTNAPDWREIDESLNDVADTFRGIVDNLRQGCTAVADEIVQLKNASDAKELRRRYQRVLGLYERYLMPLIAVVDPQGEFSSVTSQFLSLCDQVQDRQISAQDGFQPVEELRHAIIWQRDAVVGLAHEVNRELAPLHQASLTESLLLAGFRKAWSAMEAGKWHPAVSQRLLPISEESDGGVYSDAAIESYFLSIREYQPELSPLVDDLGEPNPPAEVEATSDKLQRIDALDDLLLWLMEQQGTGNAQGTATELSEILRNHTAFVKDAGRRSDYLFDKVEVCTGVLMWSKNDGH